VYTKGDKITSSDGAFGFLLPSQGVNYKMKASLEPFRHLIEWRLKSSRVEYPVIFTIAETPIL
jgi:hypothetical protein